MLTFCGWSFQVTVLCRRPEWTYTQDDARVELRITALNSEELQRILESYVGQPVSRLQLFRPEGTEETWLQGCNITRFYISDRNRVECRATDGFLDQMARLVQKRLTLMSVPADSGDPDLRDV